MEKKAIFIGAAVVVISASVIFLLPKIPTKNQTANSLTVETVPNTKGYSPSTEETTLSYKDQVEYYIKQGETLIRQSQFRDSGITFERVENANGELEIWVRNAKVLGAEDFLYLIYSPGEGIEGDGYAYLEDLIVNYIPPTSEAEPYSVNELLSQVFKYIDDSWPNYTGEVNKEELKANIMYNTSQKWIILKNASRFIADPNNYEPGLDFFYITPSAESSDEVPDNFNNLVEKLK